MTVYVFSMINIKENSSASILKIKERAITARNSERKSRRKRFHFFDVQTRITPIFFENLFLVIAKAPNLFWKIIEGARKIIRTNYFHVRGYFLSALRYERRIRSACVYSETFSFGRSKESSLRNSWSSRRTKCIVSVNVFPLVDLVFKANFWFI